MVAQCLAQWFLAVVAASYITFVVCSSGIMASTRQWIRAQALKDTPVRLAFHHLKRMVGCPFCAGFWVVVGIEVVYRLNVFPGTNGFLWNVLSVPAIVMPAAMIAFAASVMVGEVHRALDALDKAEQALIEAQKLKDDVERQDADLQIPESMALRA